MIIRVREVLNGLIFLLATACIFATVSLLNGCTSDTATQPSPLLSTSIDIPPPQVEEPVVEPIVVIEEDDEDPPNAAKGKLVIRGNYAQCEQKTNFSPDVLAIFRVINDSGAQDRIRLYSNPPAGNIPCGVELQLDCIARESNPDARPGAYNLYAHDFVNLDCRPDPPCFTCGKDDDSSDESSDDSRSDDSSERCEIEGENPGESCDEFGNGTLCFWDFNKCDWVCVVDETCEPDSICHVSNKGDDQDVQIQQSTVKLTPGHVKHLENCPPDYLGVCLEEWPGAECLQD